MSQCPGPPFTLVCKYPFFGNVFTSLVGSLLLCGIPDGFPERKNVGNKRLNPADIIQGISENVII
jgi:hypothetical protein